MLSFDVACEYAEFFTVKETLYVITPKGSTDVFDGMVITEDGTICLPDGRPCRFLSTQEQGRAYRDEYAT